MVDLKPGYDGLDPESLRRRGTGKWRNYDPDVLALWVAEMDFAAAPAVREAVADAAAREQFGYASQAAVEELTRATARWMDTRYGWSIESSQVHVLPDVLKGVELAIDRFSPRAAPVILPTPAYMPFFDVPKVIDRPIVEVPMANDEGRFTLDLEGIDRAFAAGAATIILCNPYNPLGRAFSRDELAALAAIVAHRRGRVVSDEIHAPLNYSGTHVPYASVSADAAAHSITLTSASKGWNIPGLKCAQAITTNEEDGARWEKIPRRATGGASTIGIDANAAAYRDGGGWLDETLAYLDGNRHLLAELLSASIPAARYTVPEATYLAWIDLTALELGVEPADFLLEHARVAVNPGIAFGANGTGCVRLNFATSASILEQAIERIAMAVGGR